MEKINVHFVCRGNIYRSRLAEAYLKSFQHPKWNVSSSGIGAEKHETIHTSPWAEKIAAKNNFSEWLTGTNVKTSQEMLDNSDLIVFMSEDVYRDAKKSYTFNEDKSLVWNVKDREDWPDDMAPEQKRKRTFRQIERRVKGLIRDMTEGGHWLDVVDENDHDRGFRLPIRIINRKRLWHRGCHVIIQTSDRKTFIQQRSLNIYFAPGLIDVTLGGHVDSGETPKEAAVREIKEEMGLTVTPDDLRLLEVHRWSRYHPKYKTHKKVFLHSYAVRLKEANPVIVFQKEEVRAVKLLSPNQLKRLLRFHRLVGGPRLNYSYVYYARIAAKATLSL